MLSPKLRKILRYLVSGATGAASNLLILFVLVHFAHVYYLVASILSFLGSLGIGFTLQKFWTFRESTTARPHVQFGLFVAVATVNIGINTLCMYALVTGLGVWYLAAQIMTGVVTAFTGYFGYKTFVFTEASARPVPDYSR